MTLAVVGCAGNIVEPMPDLCEAARAIRSSPGFLTTVEEADIAARVLPGGFGSLYQDIGSQPGALIAYFKDPSSAAQLRMELRKLLLCGGAYPGWAGQLLRTDLDAIAIRQGQYTGTELLSYLRALEPLRGDPEVWAMELDPETNRVWIGISSSSALSRIQQAVSTKSVPVGAVMIEPPPTTTGTEQFEVLNSPVYTQEVSDPFGTLFAALRVRFLNRQAVPRYPDWCVDSDPTQLTAYFAHTIQKWDGQQWKDVKFPICSLVLLAPRRVDPGQTVTDSVPLAASRRLNTQPYWRAARITGIYRFVGKVYMSTTPNPSGGPALLSDLAPLEEQVSSPFRLINTLPF